MVAWNILTAPSRRQGYRIKWPTSLALPGDQERGPSTRPCGTNGSRGVADRVWNLLPCLPSWTSSGLAGHIAWCYSWPLLLPKGSVICFYFALIVTIFNAYHLNGVLLQPLVYTEHCAACSNQTQT